MQNLYVDHMFTNDPRHRFFKSLKKRGFDVLPNPVEHPGKVFCRFIPLKGRVGRKVTYLEFADVRSQTTKFPKSGLSLGCLKDLESMCKSWTKRGIQADFLHKNYEWKMDNESRRPGWNFVHFKNTGIRAYYPWVTEYEPWKKRKPVKPVTHPNTVESIRAVELSVSHNAIMFYEKILGAGVKKGGITLAGGIQVNLKKTRSNDFNAVVLNCKSLDWFEKRARPDGWTHYYGKPAAVIQNPFEGSWKILVVEMDR